MGTTPQRLLRYNDPVVIATDSKRADRLDPCSTMARSRRGIRACRGHKGNRSGRRSRDGPACPRPGIHPTIRGPAIHLPHRFAGDRFRRPQPVPVPLERGTQQHQSEQIQTHQNGAARHVTPKEILDPRRLKARKLPIAPFLHPGTGGKRAGMLPKSSEFPAQTPREVAL